MGQLRTALGQLIDTSRICTRTQASSPYHLAPLCYAAAETRFFLLFGALDAGVESRLGAFRSSNARFYPSQQLILPLLRNTAVI
jgi:hypothetical protein